jgi:hypothetical protein
MLLCYLDSVVLSERCIYRRWLRILNIISCQHNQALAAVVEVGTTDVVSDFP